MARSKKKEDDVRTEVVEAMRAKNPSDREARVLLLWKAWQDAKAYLHKIRSETRTEVERLRVVLKELMEAGVAIGDQEASLRKLQSIEVAWQDLEEAKAQQRDAVGGAKDGEKAAYKTLEETVLATNQLGFEFREDGMEAIGGDEDEDDATDFDADGVIKEGTSASAH
jgi:hypothetical protein